MTIWETTIRTGDPGHDQQQLAQLRSTYEAQGYPVHVEQLPGGGFHMRVLQRPQQQQAGYSAPPLAPQGNYGGAPQANYGAPQPSYGAPQANYGGAPQANYGVPQPSYGAPQANYGAPQPSYGAPQPSYGAPAYAGGGAYAGGPPGLQASQGVGEEHALGAERVRYLRKVYGLLFISAVLAIGAGMVTVSPLLGTETFTLARGKSVQVPLVVAAMLENPGLEYGAFALLFVGVLAASLVSKVRGLNYAALFAVSTLMGVEMAPMAFVAQVLAGLGETLSANPVRDTFSMVGAIFVGLTGYIFVTRKDFSYLRATLSMGFMVVFAGCILAFVLGSEPFSLAIASVGALLSIGFLLYQTSYIFRNSEMDDPVDDALGLIVQLRNLFMFLLRIFMSRR
jgi:FtsH-binding integral membrane protein